MSTEVRLSLVALFALNASFLGCGTTPPERGLPQGGNGNSGGTSSGGSSANGGTGNVIIPPVNLADCGNSALNGTEQCDDGNTTPGDGCSAGCQIEADYLCPTPGQPCVSNATCGNGSLSSAETCDDGNTADGDGCNSTCTAIDPGWQCRVPGKKCVPLCGDGVLTGSENCDDSNTVSGDGCSSTCLTEPGWSCNGAVCIQSVCGNGMQEAGESCDAGANNGLFHGDGSGCSKTCTQEPTCRDAAGVTTSCTTRCGDANVDPGEECDDGNGVDGDGCSAGCALEGGFTCMPVTRPDTQPCTAPNVGECLVLPVTYRDFDGQNLGTGHPDFFYYGATVGGAKTSCVPNASGANLLPQQANGTCPPTDATDPCQGLVTPALGPDGKPVLNAAGGSTCACTFTDWDNTGVLTGVAGVLQCTSGAASPNYVQNVQVKVIQSADSFAQWYGDSALSEKVSGTLELPAIGNNQFQFSSSGGRTVYDDIHDIWLATKALPVPAGGAVSLSSGFFPLEGTTRPKLCNLWGYWTAAADTACVANDARPVWQQWDPRAWNSGGAAPQAGEVLGAPVKPVTGMQRNFYFTSEARYLFRFAGGETLSFFGDDDVWVYLNGHLVLDLGAPHERMKGEVVMDATGASATWRISVQNLQTGADQPIPGAMGSGTVTGLGMEVGKTYEIAIFHADRHPRESNYQLTLQGFATNITSCLPTCGDGVATAGEECDDGANNMNGAYGACSTECKFGPFCGDGILDDPATVPGSAEECDLGRMNNAIYGMPGGCSAGCLNAHYCGDGFLDAAFGEACDQGANNSDDGQCTTACQLQIK
jgi:fibro-slime domain-containing protein